MAPNLPDGRVIYVDRTYYRLHRPQRGEVVVFEHGGDFYVKRVYRAPGEMVHYFADGSGVAGLVDEDQAGEMHRRYGKRSGTLRVVSERVPEDSVWVLGDNFSRSEDSRMLGPIPVRELIGRARVEVDALYLSQFEVRPRAIPGRPFLMGAHRPAGGGS